MNSYDKWLQAPYARQERDEVLMERFEAEARKRWEDGDTEWIYLSLSDNQTRDLLATIWTAWVKRRPTALADSVAICADAYDAIDSAFAASIKAAAEDVGEKEALAYDPDDDKPDWMD